MKITIEITAPEVAFLLTEMLSEAEGDEATQSDLEAEILARLKEKETALEDSRDDDKKNTRQDGGGDYE